jgi:hypothetical protein
MVFDDLSTLENTTQHHKRLRRYSRAAAVLQYSDKVTKDFSNAQMTGQPLLSNIPNQISA